jgi:hypothetical protein
MLAAAAAEAEVEAVAAEEVAVAEAAGGHRWAPWEEAEGDPRLPRDPPRRARLSARRTVLR